MKKRPHTLCFIKDESALLLGKKKRGFGAGKWNGFGGKVEKGESIEEAVRREVKEECGLTVVSMEKRGIIDFIYAPDDIHEVHIFAATKYHGDLVETEEMLPKWFTPDRIPFADMWPDDPHWLPLFLAGRKFTGSFVFDEAKTITSYQVDRVDKF